MAVYLSPGVFPREVDLSVLPTAVGPLRPAFIGTAKKGPLNEAVFISSSQQAIDTFGEPFAQSYLMYAVLAYLEEGNECYVMRVGVECQDGQPTELSDVCIDTSGAKTSGWGRIPLFTGIDYGRINLRVVNSDNPAVFHNASFGTVVYNDAQVSTTEGPTTATLNVSGSYTGDIDDSFILVITSPPSVSDGSSVGGAGYQVIRNSDGEVVAEGYLVDDGANGTSEYISVGDGVSLNVVVSAGELDTQDSFTFSVHPNNRSFAVSVEGGADNTYQMPAATYTSVASLVSAFNALLSSEDYQMIEYALEDGSTIPQLVTTNSGERIQITEGNAFALELGTQQYAWDIPRSYLLGVDVGPYLISTQNNRVKINVISEATTKSVEFNVPAGSSQTAAAISSVIDLAGVVSGETYWESFELTVPGGETHVVIVTSSAHQYDTLFAQANFSNLKTLRFCEELNIPYPYKRAYRGFADNRLVLPDAGMTTASVPLSCETDPLGADCASDTAYFQNIVGWFVAPSAGTWVDGYTVNVEVFTEGLGDSAGRYKVTVKDSARQVVDVVQDVSFDKRADRYVGNVINPGSRYGGTLGNAFVNWEERPAFLENDVNDLTSFVVRQPSQFLDKVFSGQTNGIPTDPAYSSELDAAVIGSPALSTGIYAFQNPESIDISLLMTPGFTTGAVIGTALQMCESRGDVLYIVDPPFGLRPQQVVDWHNGMLLSDLSSAINSSYGSLYWSWVKIFDQFSSEDIWIPPSGHVSAVYSRTAREAAQWFAPAGLRRGRILTARDVEYSPSLGERDLLYGSGNAVNSVVKFPQDGITVWGQRTLSRSNTLLNRVGVRMLMTYVKKNLTTLLRNYVYEPNDSVLWKQVESTVNPFLADVAARRGLTAYKVVVDSSNNTPERIDRNELWVSVFLKPTTAVEFIVLNMVVLRTGASFSAEEVLAAGGIVTPQTVA